MPQPSHLEHVTVFYDATLFAGWPFNGGFWQFADGELLVGFMRGACDYQSPRCTWHNLIGNGKTDHVLMRSTDGGRTWPMESMTPYAVQPAFKEQLAAFKPPATKPAAIDPRQDGFCMMAGFAVPPRERAHKGYVQISQDRGRTWGHLAMLPYGKNSAPLFTFVGARPTYVVRPDGVLLLITTIDYTGFESHAAHPFVLASSDGGVSWEMLSEVNMTPSFPMGIMGYPMLCEDGTILLAVRREYTMSGAFTQVYASEDGGHSWGLRSRVNDWGSPADLNLLPDGRIVCTYGYRIAPFGIRARISDDQGRTWGREIILRDDGGSNDLGYPRSVVRKDGAIVTTYYFNSRNDPIQFDGGVRHIAATIWAP